MTLLRSWAPLIALVVAFGAACDKQDDTVRSSPPPPPMASAKPGGCAGGGGTVNDPVSAPFFPRIVDAYCVDPHGDTRTYGEQGKLDMDAVCTTAFDGECAIYTQLGLKRLVSLRYVDGEGGAGTVDVYLSRFGDVTGAYAMFTKRVVADSDPAEPTTPKPLEAGGAGAIGTGRAYVWKGTYLAELQYNNEEETPEALARSSAKVLTAIAKGVGAALPGPADLPASVRALPTEHRITNGLQLVAKDALGVKGLAPLAVGYYADDKTRYRMVDLAGDTDAKTTEVWAALKKLPGALPVAAVGDDGLTVTLAPVTPDGVKREYVFARHGMMVAGVGDEELGASPSDKGSPRSLTKDQKTAKLQAWLSASGSPPAKKR
jgi:hypothetical protein